MKHQIIPVDFTDREFADLYDQVPIWSAPFGQLLLDHVPMRPQMIVLDIGCGTGFPVLELAGRLGNLSHVVGLDVWQPALVRARKKRDYFDMSNVSLLAYGGRDFPFDDAKFDMVTSNLGVNNFDDADHAMQECYRVTKPNGNLILTTNLEGHMGEFYAVYEEVLNDFGNTAYVERLAHHIAHRGDIHSVHNLVTSAGYQIHDLPIRHFTMRYANGTAFFEHAQMRFGFMPAWVNVIAEADLDEIFDELEKRLNLLAEEQGGLRLTIPMLCVVATKSQQKPLPPLTNL